MIEYILTYQNQINFKNWFKRTYSNQCSDFYFDYLTCVDGETDLDIPNVKCDSTITWGEAADRIIKHFNNK